MLTTQTLKSLQELENKYAESPVLEDRVYFVRRLEEYRKLNNGFDQELEKYIDDKLANYKLYRSQLDNLFDYL